MGNALLRGVVHGHGSRIKIMKADGTVMKLRSPVSVKEILIDYPNHEIFEVPAGTFSTPLPERAGLVAGSLYYLNPLPLHHQELIDYNKNSNRGPFARASSHHSVPSFSSCRLHPQFCAVTATDSIKQEDSDNQMNSGAVRIVSSSYITDGSTVRVKLRLRKEDLASFLIANNVKVGRAPLIQEATRQPVLSPWKPSLDTIAEPHISLGDL